VSSPATGDMSSSPADAEPADVESFWPISFSTRSMRCAGLLDHIA